MSKFAQITFKVAGLFGVVAILPCYFLEARYSQNHPPAVTHPEFYYGFLSVALAWQILFLIISRSPERYIAIIPAACLEKFGWALVTIILFAQNRLSPVMFGMGLIDLIFGILFLICFIKLRKIPYESYNPKYLDSINN